MCAYARVCVYTHVHICVLAGQQEQGTEEDVNTLILCL